MPEYTFQCNKDDGGCGHIFPIIMSIRNYTRRHTCPVCSKNSLCNRVYNMDLPASVNVRKGDNEITIGQLAKRNSDRLSTDEKAHLTEKHNEYKYKEPTKELPKGMSRMGNLKERVADSKQRKKNPKKRKVKKNAKKS